MIDAAATKPYGFMPFYPGPGVGGHCIPCDPHYLLWQLRKQRGLRPADRAGDARHRRTAAAGGRARAGRCSRRAGTASQGPGSWCVGVAYKPDVEDVRESPAIEIIEELLELGAHVGYHDPLVPEVELPGSAGS